MIKCLVILLFSITASAEEIVDLGVFNQEKLIRLHACPTRKDFLHFIVEVLPQEPPTNKVSFTTTNNFLAINDLYFVSFGQVLLAVRSVCTDGTESAISLFKIDVRRSPPSKPTAEIVHVLRPRIRQSLEELIESHRQTNNAPPPMLPGSPKTYSQHMQEQKEFYERERRNGPK